MPFDDDYADLNPKKETEKKGLKIKNPPRPVENTPSFHELASEAFEKEEKIRKKLLTLVTQFKGFFTDHTLKINKGPIVENIEKEVLNELVGLGTEINNDPNQREGEGSAILILMMMKCMLIQRDQINELKYSLEKMHKDNEHKK